MAAVVSRMSQKSVASRSSAPRRSMVVRAEAPMTPPTPTPAVATPAPAPAAPTPVRLSEVMAFGGAAPETVNGRLAMLGFISAVGAEIASGETVGAQFADAPLPILAGAALFIAASFVPILKKTPTEAFGPFTPSAEMTNGRAAMLGLAALLVIEGIKGVALF